MDKSTFWSLIEGAKKKAKGNPEKQVEILEKELAKFPPEEIIAFNKIYDEFRFRAYRRELWAAAYIINGGCSDDGFEYFRGWLIAQGKEVYEDALRDPELL